MKKKTYMAPVIEVIGIETGNSIMALSGNPSPGIEPSVSIVDRPPTDHLKEVEDLIEDILTR